MGRYDPDFERINERNMRGQAYEKSGHPEKAVPLYEANVRKRFWGTFPYDRLRIIYTRQKRYEDAIRICEAFLANVPVDPHVLKPAHPRFEHHRDKLRAKLEKIQDG